MRQRRPLRSGRARGRRQVDDVPAHGGGRAGQGVRARPHQRLRALPHRRAAGARRAAPVTRGRAVRLRAGTGSGARLRAPWPLAVAQLDGGVGLRGARVAGVMSLSWLSPRAQLVGAARYSPALFTEVAQNYTVPLRPGAIDTQVAKYLAGAVPAAGGGGAVECRDAESVPAASPRKHAPPCSSGRQEACVHAAAPCPWDSSAVHRDVAAGARCGVVTAARPRAQMRTATARPASRASRRSAGWAGAWCAGTP